MDIAIIGTGNVGSALGRAWARTGHSITFGSRHADSAEVAQLIEDIVPAAAAASPAEAARDAQVILLAVPFDAAAKAVAGLGDVKGKVLIDCTNPIAPGLAGLTVGGRESGGERVAGWADGARVVKAFNTTGAENMADPVIARTRLTMFICGDDREACRAVADLARDAGFVPCVTGPLRHARYLEPLAMLWLDMAVKQGFGRRFGFRLLGE